MATSAEIKSNNNTLIRIKTTDKSITKGNVADQLDASIDYTVQEISTVNSNKENSSNKSTNITTDGASDTKYPSVKAVKTYVDANIPAAELLINKSTNITTDGASDTKYPSVKAVKTYVDANSGGIPVTKVVKTTITQAQIRQLFTTPITILNGFTTELKYPINVYIRRNSGDGYTLADNNFSVVDEAGVVIDIAIGVEFLAFNYSSSTGFTQKTMDVNVSSSSGDRRYLYKLKANVGNPTIGTGTIDVYVTYVEITL